MMRPIACRRACVRLYNSNHLRTRIKSFASIVTDTEEHSVEGRDEKAFKPKRKSRSPEETRRDTRHLLQQVKQRQIADDVAGLQAKFNLINLANRKASSENGPLASDTLKTVGALPAVQNDRPLAGKLHCLTMETWIKSGHQKALDQAEILFWKLIREKDSFLSNNLQQNVYIFNDAFCLIVNALTIKSKRRTLEKEVQIRVRRIVRAMEALWDDPEIRLKPNTPALNTILYVLMKERKDIKARRTLSHMLLAWENGDNRVKPNRTSFNTTISACSQTGRPHKVREIIQHMILLHTRDPSFPYPDDHAFAALLHGYVWCREIDGGIRAEQDLEWILSLSDQGKVKLREFSMTYMVNCVMQAWANSGAPDAPERTEAILRRMVDMFEDGKREVAPDDFVFWVGLNAWNISKHPERTSRATAIVEFMEAFNQRHPSMLKDTAYIYKDLVDVWLTSDNDRAGENATAVVERMKRLGFDTKSCERSIERWHRSRTRQAT